MTMKLSVAFFRQFNKRYNTYLMKSNLSSSKVSDLRQEYSKISLIETNISNNDPFQLFNTWLKEAIEANVIEPNAMCLSTCYNNKPTSRYVLLKDYNDKGFVFYTNYNSRKAYELDRNDNAAMTFWWGQLERSVRIEGIVIKVSSEESDNYFNSRPRGSQIGAWSSNQSNVIDSREALDKQEQEIKERFSDETVPVTRPPHWGGYRLQPLRIEFWKGRQSRMHDRLVFERSDLDKDWKLLRLQP